MIPKHNRARWDGHTLLNPDEAPLWSGKGPPPEVGTEVLSDGIVQHRCMITGYRVEEKWLMAEGYRIEEPTKRGNLAGAEIYYPEDQHYPD